MTVRKPEFGDPELAARTREAVSAYVTSSADIEAQQAQRQQRVEQFSAETAVSDETPAKAVAAVEPAMLATRKKPRSKRLKPSE